MSDLEQISVENPASTRDNRNVVDDLLSHISVGRILRCPAHTARKLMTDRMEHVVVNGMPLVSRETLEAFIAERMIAPEKKTPRSVYFIASMDLQRVKIGKTQSHVSTGRFADLQRQSPYALLLVAVVDGYSAVERWMHVEFHEQRLHGEWFLANPALDALIARIQADGREVSKALCHGAWLLDIGKRLEAHTSPWHPRDHEQRLAFVRQPVVPPAPAYGPARQTRIQIARRHYMKDPSTDGRSRENRGKRR